MPSYAIGDVQGCFQELQDLLNTINFDEQRDKLWFTGDLVNRGPDSLAMLRFAKKLNAVSVLGNHDLHLLAIATGTREPGKKDTFKAILNADDRDELLHWLRHLPFIHHDEETSYTMVHAGFPPQWDLQQAIELTSEVESVLRSNHYAELLKNMYGNKPDFWEKKLKGIEHQRFIINACTRMRFCTTEGQLDFQLSDPPGSQPASLQPWFTVKARKTRNEKIIFGHWASLYHGNLHDFKQFNVYPLDTGCVWGDKLTAMRLEGGKFFQVPSRQKKLGSE